MKLQRIIEKSVKFQAPGRLCSSWVNPWRQDSPRCELGRIWDSTWVPIVAHLGAKMGQDGAKLANLAPRCAQDGQLGGQDGQLGALLGASWRPFLDLGRDLAKNGESQKNDDSSSLWEVFWGPGGGLGGYVGSSWRYVGACWRHLGATWR